MEENSWNYFTPIFFNFTPFEVIYPQFPNLCANALS